MPIPFTCPHCGHPTTVDDQFAGQTGPCAACGQTITVPGGAAPNADFNAPQPQPVYQNYPTGQQPRKSSSSAPIVIVCVVVGLIFLQRDSRRIATARRTIGPRVRPTHAVHEQHEAARALLAQLP